MTTIELTEQIPRFLEDYKVRFTYGFVIQRILLYYMLFASLLIALIILYLILFKNISLQFLGILFIMLLVSFLTIREIRRINKKIITRKDVFVHGKPLTAKVIGHSKVMIYYKSEPDYMLHLQTMNDNQHIKIRCKNSNVLKQFPKGSEIMGLQYHNRFLFGPEINVEFVLKNNLNLNIISQ